MLKIFLLICTLWLPKLALAEDKIPSIETTKKPGYLENKKIGAFDFLTNLPGDYVAFAKDVFRSETIPSFLTVSGATAVGITYDYETWQPFHKEYAKNSTFKTISDVGAEIGHGSTQIYMAGALIATGLIAKNNRVLVTGSQILEVVIATGITTQALKHMIGRESPNVATTPRTGKWQWFTNPVKYSHRVPAYDAFPSGHVATAFATAMVIEKNYPEQTWIPYVSYPTIFLVGMGMVAQDGHWWADYPLSLFLGYHFAKAVTRNNEDEKKNEALTLNPWMPAPGAMGLMLGKRF